MEEFAKNGKIDLSGYHDQIRRDFVASSVSEQEVLDTIAAFFKEYDYVLDPHTAVGVKAAQKFKTVGVPMVCLATAHPAKFGAVVEQAIGRLPDVPAALAGIMERPSRCQLMDADKGKIQAFVAEKSEAATLR
jgi:threonine synthase